MCEIIERLNVLAGPNPKISIVSQPWGSIRYKTRIFSGQGGSGNKATPINISVAANEQKAPQGKIWVFLV